MTDNDPRLEAAQRAYMKYCSVEYDPASTEPAGWVTAIYDALRAFDQAQDGEIVRDDNYVRRRDGELVHEEALKRIEMLMGAEEGTIAGRELDLLTTLVQFYERETLRPAFLTAQGIHTFSPPADENRPKPESTS